MAEPWDPQKAYFFRPLVMVFTWGGPSAGSELLRETEVEVPAGLAPGAGPRLLFRRATGAFELLLPILVLETNLKRTKNY